MIFQPVSVVSIKRRLIMFPIEPQNICELKTMSLVFFFYNSEFNLV